MASLSGVAFTVPLLELDGNALNSELYNLESLTFRGLGIVINSYNKTNEMHLFLKFIFGIELYMFRTVSLSIIHQESSTVHTAIGLCHTGYADCLRAGVFAPARKQSA